MNAWFTPRNVVVTVLLVFLALVPVYSALTGNAFLMTLFTRILILAMAATSLNLILGYGGMVSFGHAVYLGIGGYAIGILAHEGVGSGFVQWPVAIAASALFALVVGALEPAHPRALFHHDHARVRAARLLFRRRSRPLRRRRRPADLSAQPVRRSDQSLEPHPVLLRVLRAAGREHLPHLADRELALRPGDPGRALERPPHAGDRLPDLSLPAGLLRHRRHHVRPRRRAARPTTPSSSARR